MKITLVALAVLGLGASAVQAQEVVKLGTAAPLTGTQSHLGKDIENGVRLAVEEYNAKGVTLGGQKVRFELMAEDDQADPRTATTVAQRLVDAGVKGVVGHVTSGAAIPASRIYNEGGVPQVSPASTNPKLTQQNFKATFRTIANDVQQGLGIGKYAATTLGKKVAIIDDRTAYGQGLADALVDSLKQRGVKPVGREFTNDKATDFTAILTSLKGKKPDVVFFGGMDAVGGPMLKQMKSLGIQAKFMGGDGICTTELAKLAGDALVDGQVVCAEAGGVDGALKKGMDDFGVKFKKRFNDDVKLYSPYVYDSVNVMVDAMQRAKSSDPAKYLPELAKTSGYKGVTGVISFDAKGDIKNGALTIYTYKAGKRDPISVVR